MKKGKLIIISLLLVGASLAQSRAYAAEERDRSMYGMPSQPAVGAPFRLFSSASRSTMETSPLKQGDGVGPRDAEPEQEELSAIEKAVADDERTEQRARQRFYQRDRADVADDETAEQKARQRFYQRDRIAGADDEKAKQKGYSQPWQVKPLLQFGYKFFRPSAAGFAALTDIPVGPDYVIGPGDRIILNLWGSVEGTRELEVNRSGEIFLPRVGSIKVWGITYGRLPEVIRAALANVFKDFDLNVTMGKLRVIKVFVVGEVKAPGDYNISSLSTLINALSAAGGPLKSGTLRTIQLKRGGKVVETVDLYDFFLKGDKSRDIRLQPGDTVFVPVIGRVAAVGGNVKRPAIYELRDEKNLGDLLALAEGFLPTGYLQRVQISRVAAHEKKVVADFNIEPKGAEKSLDQIMAAIQIQDMDIVKIFPIDSILRDHVRLTGYVLRPGDYELRPGMRLSQLLPKDNLLPEYYRDAAEITRLYPPDYHPGKIFVNLAGALAGDPRHDLELKEFDEVRIFSRWELEDMPKVRVSGEVQKPGEYRLFDKMTVRDLLMAAGNLKITAYMKNAEINRFKQTGETLSSFPITVNLEEVVKGNPEANLALQPFDELTVRRIPNWSETKERYVTLQGEVLFPGVYPFYKGEQLSSVINRAGGFTEKAYLLGAKFTRKSVQEDQQKRMDEIIAKTEQDILKKQSSLASVAASKEELEATRTSLEGLLRGLEKLKTVKAEGRMVLRVTPLAEFTNSVYDLELVGGDSLQIPKTPQVVNVLGQVYNPTSVVYFPGKSVSYYLAKTGGATREAEEDEMYIVKIDGTVFSRQQASFSFRWDSDTSVWNFNNFFTARLDPGDTLVVPQKLEHIAWLREIKDIAVILGNLALAAGVVVAAGL